jgi:membrane carboxypeptidase/penicillin-binding protein
MRIVFILVTICLFVIVAAQAAVAAHFWMDSDAVVARAAHQGALRVPAGGLHFNSVERTIAINEFAETWGQHAFPCRTLARAWSEIVTPDASVAPIPVSQALAAKILPAQRDSVRGQVRRLLVACQLERRLDDVQMLRVWLASAPFGQQAIGVENAAHTVFGKPANALDGEESAKLTVLLHAPGLRNWPDLWAARAKAVSDRVAARSR